MEINIVEKSKENYQKFKNRHQKILDAAIRLFGERGYAGTTTSEIAKYAEVDERTLYRHFPNKSGLFNECYELANKKLSDAFQQELENHQHDELGILQAYMSAYFNFAKNYKQESLIFFHAYSYRIFPEFDKNYRKASKKALDMIEKGLEAMKKKGALNSNADTRFLAALFIGQFYAIVYSTEFADPKTITTDTAHQLVNKILEIF